LIKGFEDFPIRLFRCGHLNT